MVNDADILLWINGHGDAGMDTLMWYISRAQTWIPLYALLLGLLAYKYRSWKAMLLIAVAFAVAVGASDFLCSGVLKPLVCRLRPTHEPSIDPIRLVRGYTGGLYGFCSSHAANTMACATLFCLLYRNKTATACLMTWVALNCYSRMYLGVHYPTDILVGLLIGALAAGLVYWLAARWLPREAHAVALQGGS